MTGQPDVVPVAFELDGSYIWVGGVGPDVARTRKLRNIGAGRSKVSLVFDDLVSMEPFIARRCAWTARLSRRSSGWASVGPGLYSRITPTVSWSWNLQVSPPVNGGMTPSAPCTSRDLR